MAGAQLLDVNFEEAIQLLKDAIDDYMKEGDES